RSRENHQPARPRFICMENSPYFSYTRFKIPLLVVFFEDPSKVFNFRFECEFEFPVEVFSTSLIDVQVDAQHSARRHLVFRHRSEIRLRNHGLPPDKPRVERIHSFNSFNSWLISTK